MGTKKANQPNGAEQLEQIPNVGRKIASDLRRIGIKHPRQLSSQDALGLYRALCKKDGRRHDPCVLDVFLAAIAFMKTGDRRPWWKHTAHRKTILKSNV